MHELPPDNKNEIERTKIRKLLECLQSGKLIENPDEIAIVVAHQDDESIGFGLPISLAPTCLMVHVTDGAPVDNNWWSKGVETREQYAQIRARELDVALESVSHMGEKMSLGSIDREAVLHLTENAQKLADLFKEKGIKIAMTHAYEGGHPDHDAVAFSVHAAKEILKKQGISLGIIEAPIYRMDGKQFVAQKFIPDKTVETVEIPLSNMQMVSKAKFLDLHRSQTKEFETLLNAGMSTENEWLRESPEYNFTEFPNGGNLSGGFGTDQKKKWRTLTSQALKDLGLTGKF